MRKILLSTSNPEENRIAVVDNGILADYLSVYTGQEDRRSSIYCGIVEEIEKSLDACFVSIDENKKGFLQFSDIHESCLLPGSGNVASRLKSGMPILVQIVKDSRGQKGPLLTTRIKLTSNHLLLMPREQNGNRLHISRKADQKENERLLEGKNDLQAPEGMSLIIRSNGLDKSIPDLVWEQKNLLSLWDLILKIYLKHDKPILIYEFQNIINICLAEYLTQNTDELVCDDDTVLREVKDTLETFRGANVPIVSKVPDNEVLFNDRLIQQLDSLTERKVQLRSGGELVIDTTEAMVTVDVNSKRSRGQSNIEQTAYSTNIEAATEVAVQMKLRNLAGLIVIDFIDMTSNENRSKLENHVRREFRKDSAKINIGTLSQFGLLEMTRQNIGRPLYESHTVFCEHCQGTGRTPTVLTSALVLLDKIRDQCLSRPQIKTMYVELALEPATYLLNEKRKELTLIYDDFGIEVIILPSPTMQGANHRFRMEKNARASFEQGSSTGINDNPYVKQSNSNQRKAVPAITSADVKQNANQQNNGRNNKRKNEGVKNGESFVANFIRSLFGESKAEKTAAGNQKKNSNKKQGNRPRNNPNRNKNQDGKSKSNQKRRSNPNRNKNQNQDDKRNGQKEQGKETMNDDNLAKRVPKPNNNKPANVEAKASTEHSNGAKSADKKFSSPAPKNPAKNKVSQNQDSKPVEQISQDSTTKESSPAEVVKINPPVRRRMNTVRKNV